MTTKNGSRTNHVRTYVLIDAEPKKVRGVVNRLRRIKDVSLVDTINGPFSAIAVVEGKDASEVAATILVEIRKLKGVRDIVVYLATPDTGLPVPSPTGSAASKNPSTVL